MDMEQPNLIPDTHDPNPMPEAETLSETVGMQADQQDERLQAALRSMTSAPQDYSLTPMFQTTGTETGLSAPKPAINTVSLPPDSAQVVQRFMEDQQAMLAYSTQHALERTPDEAVKQNKIAKETGMGLDMVVRNYTDLHKEWRARQIEQADLFKTSPVLAEHMMRPEFSGVAVDDVEQLSGIEKAIAAVGNWAWNDKSWFWERWSRRSEGGTVAYTESEYGAQQIGGKPNLLEQWFEPETGQGVAFDENVKATMDVMYNDMLKRMSPEQARQEADRAGAILMTKHKFDARIAELRNGAEGELLSSFADLFGYEWQGGMQSQEAIAAGLVAGAGAGAFAAAPTGEIAAPVTVPGLAIAGAAGAYAATGAERSIRQTAGMMYLDMLDHGVAPDLARDYAMKGVWVAGPIYMLTHGVAQNMVSGAATRYASKKATNELADAAIQKALVEPTVRSAVVAVGKNAALPATAGFLGGATQSLIMSAARDGALQASGMPRMMDSSEGRAKILQEAVDMGVFMAIGAGMTNVLVPGERNPILETFRQRKRFLESEQQERFFQAVHDKARESKLADRDPEALGEFTDQAAREAGIDGMYISKAGLVQVMREMNLSMDKVDQLLPGASEQLKDPTSGDVVVGGYIKVKSGDVLGKLAKTEFGGRLMRHVTGDESIPTPAERAEALRIGSEMIADFNETPQQMMEKATELIERDNAKRESAQRVADNHAKALIDAGRPEDVAHADAAVMAGFAVALADKMGMTPEQAARLFPINVTREGEPAAVPTPAPREALPIAESELQPLSRALGTMSAQTSEHNVRVANEGRDKQHPMARAGIALQDSVRRLQEAVDAKDDSEIAHQSWRLRNRLETHGDQFDANTRASIESMLAKTDAFLSQRGIEVFDPRGQKLVSGWTEVQVVNLEQTDERNPEPETIKQTVKPVIRRNGEVVSRGEVVATYGTPEQQAELEARQAKQEAEMRARLEGRETQSSSMHQELVQRDADGNVISLSERFNPESQSILEQTPAPIPNWARGQSDVEITPEMQKEAIANSPKASQAERNYAKIDAIFDKFPNPLASEETWRNWMATLVGDSEVLDVPLVALKYANDPNAVAEYLRTLRPDQLASRRAGFALGEKIRAQYESGEAGPLVTGRLLLWAILSRKAGAYPHESAYMDLVNAGVDKWIEKALNGNWSKADGNAYVDWSSKFMESKKGGVSPGAGVTSNANDYGRVLLTKMSEKDSNGKSALQRLHDIIADKNTTTNEIRRAFFGLGDSVGIQNKVLSFALLVTGRWDTLVLDRVQFTHLWGSEYQKRAGYDNIYDGKDGGLAPAGNGHYGLAIYEALARGMTESVRQGYELAGLTGTGDGTLGAFHWDSWLIESSQAIGHPTVEALSTVLPRPDLAVRLGKFDTFAYNFEYRADGQYQVPHLDGSGYRLLSPAEAAAFMDRLSDPKNNVVPKGFKVSKFDSIPWVDAQGVDRARYDAILNEYGRPVDAADVAPAGSADARRPVPSGAGELEQSTAGGRGGAGDRGGTPEAGEVSPLAGAPRINGFTGPDPRIVAVAKQYAAANGINFRRQSEYATVDPLRAKRIAAAYEEMPHAPQDPRVKAAYAELIKQTRAQYDALYAAGYRFYFADENNKPYQDKPDGFDNPMNAVRDLRANQQMAVFPTDAGFGSGATKIDVSRNPLLADTGLMWHFGTPDGPLKPVSANDLFRAVHDAFGHSLEGAGFRARGEENAWQAHVRLFTGDAIGAMTSETRGQNSWLNYGPHGESNQTAKVGKTVFADQKTGLMPDWTWREGIVSDHTLEQAMPAPGGRRGAYDVARRLIKINKSSDATTVAHEVIHAITTTYQKLSMSSNAPEIIKDDFDKLLQWHGVAGATRQERFDNFHAMSFEQQKPFQEAVASSAEIYLSEGKAPTEALQPVFARFANWMRAIYGDIRTRLNDQYRAKFGKDLPMLTDDVRRVFDRMLATPDEIKRAEEARDMKAHFQTKEEALAGGLTEEGWAAYQQMQQEAHDAAVAELDANSLRVVQWARGARKREERALDKQLREERVKIREQVTEDLAKDKTYRAQSFIKYGTVSVESATGDTPPAPMLFANDATISEVLWAISREVEHDQAKISKSQHEQFRKVVENIDSTMTVEQLRAEAAKPEVPAKPADKRLGLDAVPGTPKNFAAIKAVALIDRISKQYAERMERVGHKLNADAVKAMIGEEAAARLGYGKYGMLAPDGAPPDVMAEMFGFDSGEEMVSALVNAKPLKEEISNRVEERVHAEHSGLIDPKRRQEAIERAIHNEARARMIAVDLRHITKATQPAQVMLNAAKSAARDHINNKKIADIKVSEYSAAESRAARLARSTVTVNIDPEKSYKAAYSRAFADAKAVGAPDAVADVAGIGAGDIARKAAQDRLDAHNKQWGDKSPAEIARRAKQQQLFQNQLVVAATDVKDEIDTSIKDFRKFFAADDKLGKSRNIEMVSAARAILASFGLGKSDKTPADYIKQMQQFNPDLYAALEPIILRTQRGGGDYTQLTVNEFRAMRDAVEALWNDARRDQQVTIEGRQIAKQQVVTEVVNRLKELGLPETVPGEQQAPRMRDKWFRTANSVRSMVSRVEHWADAMDGPGGNGPFTRYIFNPIKEALVRYRVDQAKYLKRYADLVKKLDLQSGKIAAPELNYTFGGGNGGNGKLELLGALLHIGNLSNLRKLLLGRGWGSLNEDGTVDTSRWDAFVERMINEGKLTKEDFEFLQSVWDLTEELKPLAQKAHRDMNGFYFKEVEATPVSTPWGDYRGGYVPAKVDPFIVQDAQVHAKMDALEGRFDAVMPSTGLGFTKARVEYNQPLALDLRLIGKHIDDVLRYSHVQPALKDVMRVLNSHEVKDALSRRDPTAIQGMLIPWLNRAARDSSTEVGRMAGVDRFWNAVRSRTSLNFMVANLRQLGHLGGFSAAYLKVEAGYINSALVQYMSSPHKTAEIIAEMSPEMADRMQNRVRDAKETLNDILLDRGPVGKTQAWVQQHGMFLSHCMHNQMDIVIWLGAFNQEMERMGAKVGDAEAQADAVRRADAAVRMTQGAGHAEDVSAYESGTPFYKTMTQFQGYLNTLMNLNAAEYTKAIRDMGIKKGAGRLVAAHILAFAIPMLAYEGLIKTVSGDWNKEEDDGWMHTILEYVFASYAHALGGMVPFGSPALTFGSAAFHRLTGGAPSDKEHINVSPSLQSLESATLGTADTIHRMLSEDKEINGHNVRDTMTLMSLLTGIPLTPVAKPLSYEMEVRKGKVQPTSTADYIRGMASGTASPASKGK